MADIKTNLRELSVLVGVYVKVNGLKYNHDVTEFIRIIKENIRYGSNDNIANLSTVKTFSSLQLAILDNGFSLAEKIINEFKIEKIDELIWYGFVYKQNLIIFEGRQLYFGEHGFI